MNYEPHAVSLEAERLSQLLSGSGGDILAQDYHWVEIQPALSIRQSPSRYMKQLFCGTAPC